MDAVADLFTRVTATTESFMVLVVSAAFLVGLFASFVGIRKVATSGGASVGDAMARERSIGFAAIIGGAFLLAFPALLAITGPTLFDAPTTDTSAIFDLAPGMTEVFSDPRARTVLTTCLLLIQLIGAIAIFRALSLFMKAPYHPGMGLYGRAATHLFGGALAWNIVLFTEPIEQLFLGT